MPTFTGYISYAPFPEGFQGDLDETFQQSGQLATFYISGNFLTGIYYPTGTTPPPTLPTSDQGPVAMNGVWYFWDPVTGQYLPQSSIVRTPVNYCKNPGYQVAQLGTSFTISATGATKTFDMAQVRATEAAMLSVAVASGPAASGDTDYCGSAINYTVGPNLLPTPAATDLFVHEHLVEGADILMAQGETLSLGFSVWVNQPGTYSAYLTSHGRDMSYVFNFTVATGSTWARIKINGIPALPTTTGTWNFGEGQTGLYLGIVMAVGAQYQTATPGQWVSGFFAGTSQNVNLLTVVNNQMMVTAIKLEASPTCTYCAMKSFEGDYHDCIRYYWSSFNYQSTTAGVYLRGSSPSVGQINFGEVFPRRMCAAPAVVPYSYLNHNAGYVTDLSLSFDTPVANLSAVAKGIAYQGLNNLSTTGTTNSTVNITAIPSTTGLVVGMPVAGSGIPAGATIATIVSGTAITISIAASTSLAGTPLIFGGGGIVTTGTTATSTSITAIPSTTGLAIGMAVSGSGVPAGATITQVNSSTSITISIATTSSLTGTPLAFSALQKGDLLLAYVTADARLS